MTEESKFIRFLLTDEQLIEDIEHAKFDYDIEEREVIIDALY
jgi:hypothetical protein